MQETPLSQTTSAQREPEMEVLEGEIVEGVPPNHRKGLTPDERDQIVELKLERVPVRKIAELIPCTTRTVQVTWHNYVEYRNTLRRQQADAVLGENLLRLEKNARDARLGLQRAQKDRDARAAASMLDRERAALCELIKLGSIRDLEPEQAARVTAAKVAVMQAAMQGVIMSAAVALTPEQRRAAVAELRVQMRGIAGPKGHDAEEFEG
jgi:hypothetical protein